MASGEMVTERAGANHLLEVIALLQGARSELVEIVEAGTKGIAPASCDEMHAQAPIAEELTTSEFVNNNWFI